MGQAQYANDLRARVWLIVWMRGIESKQNVKTEKGVDEKLIGK